MKSDEMRATFSRWKKSGLSLRAYGIREGINYSKLVYWRRRFEPRREEAERVELAPVHVVAESQALAAKPETIGVWLPNGIAVDVPPGVASEDLLRLIETLSRC